MMRRISIRKITIIQSKAPLLKQQVQQAPQAKQMQQQTQQQAQQAVNEELQWFGSSLGLFGLRDKDKSCFRIFVELIRAAKENREISSNEIAEKTGLARGTVVHHLNNMLSAGIIIATRKGYCLRVSNLQKLVDAIEQDSMRACSQLRNVARQIDKSIGLK